jgi:hypothetical protein
MVEAHNAVDIAQKQDLIPEKASDQVKVILQVQQFIEQQLAGFSQELGAIDQAAQQFAPQPPMPPDSSMQVAQIGAQVQQMAIQQRAQSEQQRLAMQVQLEQAKLQDKQQDRAEKLQAEQLKVAAENERTAADLAARERMNTADNDTAKLLAAAEMATGEKVAISTGTGLNPGP